MWDSITYAELRQARTQLQLSRDEIARRHAEELKGLDAEREEVAALERLVADFARRFKPASGHAAASKAALPEPAKPGSAEPEAAAAPEPAEPESAAAPQPAAKAAAPEPAAKPAAAAPPAKPSAGQRAAAARHPDERKYPQTNFDTFRRALSGRI